MDQVQLNLEEIDMIEDLDNEETEYKDNKIEINTLWVGCLFSLTHLYSLLQTPLVIEAPVVPLKVPDIDPSALQYLTEIENDKGSRVCSLLPPDLCTEALLVVHQENDMMLLNTTIYQSARA